MSAKIYKGFRISTDSFAEAMNIINAFKPWVQGQAEVVFDTFIENVNKSKAENGADSSEPQVDAYTRWIELRHTFLREKQMRMPHIDTDFSVSLIPTKDMLLGIVYTEHNEWYDAWCKQPGVEEYSYWNNTDPPEDIDYEDWEKRGENWEILNYQPVCVQAFSIDLVDPSGPLPKGLRQ